MFDNHEKQKYLAMSMMFLLIVGIVAVAIVGLVMAKRQVYRSEVSFTATGKVFAKPDIAQVQLGVKTGRVSQPVEAVSQNAEKLNQVITVLAELGIEEKDIKTSAYSLNPVYDYQKRPAVIIGYEVYQQLTVKVRDLDKIGLMISKAVKLGTNQVGNISFTIDDPEELKDQARQKAILAAKAKANKVAELTGLKLGDLVNVYETLPQAYPPGYYERSAGFDLKSNSVEPNIASGQSEISLEVTLVYLVKE